MVDAASGQRRQLAEQIIAQVRSGGAETASLLHEAGLPPDGRYLAVVFGGITREPAEELLAGYTSRMVVALWGDQIVALVLSPPDAVPFADWLRDAAAAMAAPGIRFTAGVSGPVDGCGSFAVALREATIARRLAVLRSPEPVRGSVPPPVAVAVATSADADSHELLLASVAAPVLRSFRDRLLGPVTAYDERHHAELVPTLRAFLDCNGSWSTCAAKLYVHVNTVRYRIGRIEELTGRDLSSLANRVDFFLALRS
jgi:PucR C-terminal helix-turn-helix domain/GGDEF-like domain